MLSHDSGSPGRDGRGPNLVPQFRILGPLTVRRGGRSLSLGPPRQRLVLAVLLLSGGHSASTERLIEAVWGTEPPRTARASLRNSVSGLRAVLGDTVVFGVDGGYGLDVAEFDLDTVTDLVARARRTTDPSRRLALLTEAQRLWTDEPLAGLTGPFARFQRSRLTDLRFTVEEQRLDIEVTLDRPGVVDRLVALCRAEPFREEPHRLLMAALHRRGRDREALAVHDRLGSRLADTLGIDPCAAVTRLRDDIVRRSVTPMPCPAQLPVDCAVFTGRVEPLARIGAVLATGGTVAIGGAAGVGKTALAVRAAHRSRSRFPDGQLFADLRGSGAEPVDPVTVLVGFLRALGRYDPADGTAGASARFAAATRGRRLLMVLDDVRDAEQVRPLLMAAGDATVLITGRSRLDGVPGVARVDLDVLDPGEAADLFGTIVGSGRVVGEPVGAGAVVAAGDRSPLSVRLAAARALSRPQWALAELADRIADPDGRRRELLPVDGTVLDDLASAQDRLDPTAARCLRRLAAVDLTEPTGPEAAAVVGLSVADTATVAATLDEAGLLSRSGSGHYRLPDPVRLLVRGQATGAETAAALRRLLRYQWSLVVTAVDVAHPGQRRPSRVRRPVACAMDATAARHRLAAAVPGILATVRQATGFPDDTMTAAVELIRALVPWVGAHRPVEAFVTAADGLADAAHRHGSAAAEAHVRLAAADCLLPHHPDRAVDRARRAVRPAMDAGDRLLLADVCLVLAMAMARTRSGRPDRILAYQSRAIACLDVEPGLTGRAASARCERAVTLLRLGRVDRAVTESTAAVAVLRGLADPGALLRGLYRHGLTLRTAGRVAAARRVFEESGDLAAANHDHRSRIMALCRLAGMHADCGAAGVSLVYAHQAMALSRHGADDRCRAHCRDVLERCLAEAAVPEPVRQQLAESAGLGFRAAAALGGDCGAVVPTAT